jgi:hypothetical protein
MWNICIEKLSIKTSRKLAHGRSRPVATPYFGSIERPLSMVAMIESDPVSQIRFRLFYTYCHPYYIIFPVLFAFFTPFTLKTFFNLIIIFHPQPINRSQNRFLSNRISVRLSSERPFWAQAHGRPISGSDIPGFPICPPRK